MTANTEQQLPKGWRWAELGDVCDILGGCTLPPTSQDSTDDRVYCIKVSDLDQPPFDGMTIQQAPAWVSAISVRGRQLRPGAVVFPKRGGAIATNRKRILRVCALLDPNLMGLQPRPRSAVLPEFLWFWLRTQDLAELASGNVIPQINRQDLAPLLIPLPPLPEQRRIAAVLSEQMAAVDAARAAGQAQISIADRLIASCLEQSLGSGEPQRIALSDVLQEVTSGVGPDWTRYPVTGVSRTGAAPPKEPVGKSPERYKLLCPGTIFYNPMRILLGSIGIVDADDLTSITSPDYVVFHTLEPTLNARWFYYWLRSAMGAAFIQTLTRGAVRERMLFRRLAGASLDVPPPKAQALAAEQLGHARVLGRRAGSQLATINELPAALLRQAFSGEL